MIHSYVTFRTRLAYFALAQLVASLEAWALIVLVLVGPLLLGLFAMAALPILYAATLGWSATLAAVAVSAALCTLPVLLLRKRLVPGDVLRWTRALPIPSPVAWQADAAVAAIVMAPVAATLAISLGVWTYQWPSWLHPFYGRGTAAIVAAMVAGWACCTVMLNLRARRKVSKAGAARARPADAVSYIQRRARLPGPFLWHRLFWLPFWRIENAAGFLQTALLAATVLNMFAWLWPAGDWPRPLFGVLASVLMILMTDRGEKAVREQIARLAPVMAAWPIQARRVALLAKLFCLLPATLVIFIFGVLAYLNQGALSRPAALAYLGVAGLSQLAIVAFPRMKPRGRVGLVMLSILVLISIGSELWE